MLDWRSAWMNLASFLRAMPALGCVHVVLLLSCSLPLLPTSPPCCPAFQIFPLAVLSVSHNECNGT